MADEYEYTVKGKTVTLTADEDTVAVRYREPAPHSMRASAAASAGVGPFGTRLEVPGEKFTMFDIPQTTQPHSVRQANAAAALANHPQVARVAPVFKMGDRLVLATDRILVGFKPQTRNPEELLKSYGGEIVERTGDECLVRLGESADPLDVAKRLSVLPEVEYAEPDFVTIGKHVARTVRPYPAARPRTSSLRRPLILPLEPATIADPLSESQYAIRITHAVDAWTLQLGDPTIKIAILDEGVDTAQEDLSIAIVGSYDAIDDDEFQEPNAWDAHGTACAGLAAAIHGNQRGVMGIGGGCSLLAVRIAYSPAPQADWVTSNAVIRRAIDWAWQRGGADVLSNSWGGGAPSTAITNAFERARTQGRGGKGCVIVIAAGNASGPVDFPGDLPHMLTVSASNEHDEPKTKTSQDGEFWWGSNFGPEVVVAAPGVHNYTTDISGEKGYNPGGPGAVVDANYVHNFNGTSSATPIVAGAVGLVLSANRNLTEVQVREIIRDSADKVGSVPYVNSRNDRMGYGRLNVYRAVQTALGLGLSVQGKITQAAPASFVLRTNTGEEFLLRRYQGSEGVSWHLLENQNLAYLAQFEGQQVTVHYSRRQDSGQGSILWGASVVS